jgi:hypothetical protein
VSAVYEKHIVPGCTDLHHNCERVKTRSIELSAIESKVRAVCMLDKTEA